MKTLRLTVDPVHLDSPSGLRAITLAADILRGGGLVAFPTETVYGLGANALDPAAVARIFEAKKRPSWDPVIVHIAGPVSPNPMLDGLITSLPDNARQLMEAFWPGPLTLLLPRSASVPDSVTAGRPLVGIRMPAHPVAYQLIRQAGVPVAAPSANTFSHTSPTTAAHVLEDLDGRIDAILDAGPTLHGLESTVLDPCQSPMVIYRPGTVTADQIRTIAGPTDIFQLQSAPGEALPSPGVGIRHYAPRARLILVDAPLTDLPHRLAQIALTYPNEKVGLMLPAEIPPSALPGTTTVPWGTWAAPEVLARTLYSGLRSLDALGCAVILCPLPPADGIGAAIRDRLKKAAHHNS